MKSHAEKLLDKGETYIQLACEAIIPSDAEDVSHEARMAVNSLGGAINCIAAARDHLSQPVTPFIPGSEYPRLMRRHPPANDEGSDRYISRLLKVWQREQGGKPCRSSSAT